MRDSTNLSDSLQTYSGTELAERRLECVENCLTAVNCERS